MAPPSKRRRLGFSPSNEVSQEREEAEDIHHHRHHFAHTVTQLDTTPVQTSAVEELHVQIQNRQAVSVEIAPTISVGLDITINLPGSATSGAASSAKSTDPSVVSASSSSVLASSQTVDNLSSVAPLSSSISSISAINTLSTPTITSSIPLTTSSSVRNTTVAENVLTSGLNSTYFGAASRTGSLFSSLRSNSSYTFTSSSTTTESSSADNVMTSVVLTTATISQDGQAASTITTQVGAIGYSAPPAPTTTNPTVASGGGNSNPDPPPPGTIAGGVVGGAAGLAVLLLVAMLFLRWYRRRSQHAHQALLPDSAGRFHDSEPEMSRDGPGMAERAGIRPWVAAIPALMRHQQSSRSTSSVDVSTGQERGFQRISGRKLPSAWSPGIEAPPPMPGADLQRASGTSSFYPDGVANDDPFADSSEGATPENESGLGRQQSNERMTVVPGPQRRPTIHNPNKHLMPGDAQAKHMSSMARTSGTASTLFQPESNGSHGPHLREQV